MDGVDGAIDHMRKEHQDATTPVPAITPEEFEDVARWVISEGFDDRIRGNFDPVVRYIWASRKGYARKGLCLMGTVGTGKTMAMQQIEYPVIPASLIADRYRSKKEWYREFLYGYWGQYPSVCIDDLGAEATTNDYGTRLEVMGEVINARVRMYVAHGSLTHITTNLTKKDMDERYGPRMFSRITEMCNVVVFEGPDRRNTGNEEFMQCELKIDDDGVADE